MGEKGAPLYICRAVFEGGVHPGKIRSDFGGCNVGWGGAEHTVSKYQTLVPYSTINLTKASGGHVPSNAIKGGHESDGTPLYLCSGEHMGGTHPGKTRDGFAGCNIGWGGKEVAINPYEILVKQSNIWDK